MTNDDELLKRLGKAMQDRCATQDTSITVTQAAARIRELEDKVRHYEAYVKNVYDADVSRVAAGTHVIVPVEPNREILSKMAERGGSGEWDNSIPTKINLMAVMYQRVIGSVLATRESDNA